MTFKLSRTFFVPLTSIIFLLSLSSCGKDYDLVSEYVIRDANKQVQLSTTQEDNTLKITAVHTSSANEIKKK